MSGHFCVAESEDFNLHDFNHRLQWPTECRDKEKEEHTPNFVKSEWMNFLWNPISVLENIGSADKPNYEKTIRIGQASDINLFYKNPQNTGEKSLGTSIMMSDVFMMP